MLQYYTLFSIHFSSMWLVHTADLVCGVVGGRRCFWVPVHNSVVKFKGSFVLGGLKFSVLMWWEKCLCKGRAGSWPKPVIYVFFCKCLNTTSWSWHAGVGHLARGCISFLQGFRSQWTRDLQCLAGNSAGFFETLHKSCFCAGCSSCSGPWNFNCYPSPLKHQAVGILT